MKKRIMRCGVIVFLMIFLAQTAWSALPEFTQLAAKSGEAVVNISTVKTVTARDSLKRFIPKGQEGSPLEDFFDQFDQFFGKRYQQSRKERSLGSGFLISGDGYIVTNNHVVEGADEIKVKLRENGKREKGYLAELVGTDSETDLALLKIHPKTSLPYLDFGDSEKIEVGEWVMAIGNPFGLDHTVTAGIISAKGRVIGAGPYDNFLQTDASINPGNSGGPLLNMRGEVIGINSAIVASGQGIGFAIPSSMAKDVIEQLKEYQKVKRGLLGVMVQAMDDNTAKALGLGANRGALVASTTSGGPADRAGIKAGDVILAADGEAIEDYGDLTRKIGSLAPGAKVNLTLWRKGKRILLTAFLDERLPEGAAASEGAENNGSREDGAVFMGMSLRPPHQNELEILGLQDIRGLLVADIKADSSAVEAGIAPGDLILEANQKAVNSVAGFREIVQKAKKNGVILLLVQRKGQHLFRSIPLD